ncbi:DUF2169 domain-containing protein [Rhizobacter sp. Root1221]|uniref:DUF2169 family type VI secretion system accessory protein n=1 Tax=Rhizobacter sp. Root1221 TaxID=1736433 RepID=UPI0006FE148D|nr:DUF2169 domain-containing protein [Rhizobacter sp. Root1221]KQV96825.1 hypothetical protein ASC87_24840 [Rhizobacter sp. Root1221]
MELLNATRMIAGYNLGVEPSGRESLVVVIKGTFRFPVDGEPAGHFALHDVQAPLVMADTFTGAPGFSAPVHEVDFAPRKTRCDILLVGSAHAPQGQPAARVDVGVRIGDWLKALSVVGPRRWDCGVATLRATAPEPFVVQPISYDVAYGGVDTRHDDPAQHAAFLGNPVGRGFHKHLRKEWVDGKPLPLTEEIGRPVSDTDGDYRPMAFGPLGRGWSPRAALAGTYDDAWREQHFPFLPPDFDARYHQAAPEDQQVPLDFFSRGPMEVTLSNLTPEGHTQFTIPSLVAPVTVFPKRGDREELTAVLDTVVIEPDLRRFTLTWRAVRPLRKSLFEIAQVLVGKKGRDWWQLRDKVTFPIPVVMVPMERPTPTTA